MSINMQSAPTNYLSHVKFIVNMYESQGVVLSHAFQKDAIQNAAGARLNPSKWNGWKCNIELVQNEKGSFLIVEDFGTTGLTGPNLTIDQITEMCTNDVEFPENYRLARLSCRNVSGDLSAGAGLFGVGKTLYSAASEKNTCKYYFESLIDSGEHRANVNDKNMLRSEGAFVNDEARNFIIQETGLKPIEHVGTRFIIVNPKEEIKNAILDGTMYFDAAETWWRIIPYLSEDEGIFIQGKRVEVPEGYSEENINNHEQRFSDKHQVIFDDYCSKRYGFAICKELDERLSGFYFYRRGMKVGKIELTDIPKELENNYYGFIELQNDYEDELALIENSTHYDVVGTKKHSKSYSALRDFVREYVKECLISWGYIKTKENDNKKFYKLAKDIQNQIQNLFKENGFEEIGKGDIKKQYHSGFLDVVYPNPDEERTVHDHDEIRFKFYIKNHLLIDQKYNVRIQIVSKNKTTQIFENQLSLEANERYISKDLIFVVSEETAEKYLDNAIVLIVEPLKGLKNQNKKIYFYYEIDTKKTPEFDFDLIMSNRNMPRLNDKRVNSGESITDVQYSISNNTSETAKVLLTVNALNCEDGNSLIDKVFKNEYMISRFSEIQSDFFDIYFNPAIYDDKLSKGKIQIRARAIMADKCGLYSKGEIVGEYNYFVFFNKNEKSGIEDSFEPSIIDNPDDKRCSFIEGKQGNRKIVINVGHPEFKSFDDDKTRGMYIAKHMIKEFAYLYLREGKFGAILENDPDGSKTSPVDIIEILNKKIDELWWAKCQN